MFSVGGELFWAIIVVMRDALVKTIKVFSPVI